VRNPDWPRGWLRARFGYEPRDEELFAAALTHRSAAKAHNERLEFLGDAVLNLVVSEELFRLFPQADEGDLSRLRARLVSGEPLAQIAAGLDLGAVLQLGSGELRSGGFRRQSILADAFEALCGALFLDAGLEQARELIRPLFAPRIAALPEPEALKDAKTRLQEHLQAAGLPLPRYHLERTEGEPHAQTFHVGCEVQSLHLFARGSGTTRRAAEQAAAERVLLEIQRDSASQP
jgi:ribonuclease-3